MDNEPDETIITPQGAVQRWDTPEGMTFRLDVWTSGTESPPDFLYEKSGDNDEREEEDAKT